jgi:hypothetical protein
MPKATGAFYAYPSQPSDLAQTIETAAQKMPKLTKVKVRTRRSLSPTGKYVIDHITQAIGKNEIFACDLTYPNPNVVFELGFAIARLKGFG